MEIKHIISIQFPIVFVLMTLSFIIYRTVGLKEFRYLSAGWAFNLLYLLLCFYFRDNKEAWTPKILITLFNLLSTGFFLLTIRYNSIESEFTLKVGKIALPILVSILFLIGVAKLIPISTGTDYFPTIIVRNIPTAILDFTTFLLLAFYTRKLSNEYNMLPIAFYGFLIYSIVQFLSIFQPGMLLSGVLIEKIGFTGGLMAKFLILIGLMNILPSSKEIQIKKAIATKLDDILGKTFHEIRYPLKSMSNDLSRLLPTDEDKTISNKNEIMDHVKRIDSAFNHLAAIVGASYKLYETDIGKPLDNEDQLIGIPGDKIETISVNPIIQIAILKIKPFTNENIDFHCDFASNCYIDCHSYQLVQVFLNFFKNSQEAFHENKGKITIRTRVRTSEVAEERHQKTIEVIIEDNGPGIPLEIASKIFHQGFTTKSNTSRRGFGLSIVKEIIEASKGTVNLQDSPGKGTCFIITFPQAKIFPKRP